MVVMSFPSCRGIGNGGDGGGERAGGAGKRQRLEFYFIYVFQKLLKVNCNSAYFYLLSIHGYLWASARLFEHSVPMSFPALL